ncbi:DUF362 domain-containing protein [Candidatus Dojkabacteria bacterium]|nr:DUF362 domain-containing protein [Candidatus Dojkabacteria bacterium]
MDKVHFLKNFEDLYSHSKNLLKNTYKPHSKILVKLHFGEPGNKTAFKPEDVKPIIKALNELKLEPTLIDSPVAYNSPRGTVEGYEQFAKQKGFNKLAPCLISNNGKRVEMKDIPIEVIKELIEAENVLVLSHVKGHGCAGFGGAIKNLGMGGVTKESKSKIHGLCKPKFIKECQGCGTCAKLCPAHAIKMTDGKAEFDLNACYGCSICEIECPFKCLAPIKAIFDDLLAQGAAAVINNFPENTFYINVIKNITEGCDCQSNAGQILSDDIGVLLSKNPVAIDHASIDLINKTNEKNIFLEHTHKDPLLHVEYAAKYTNWEEDYEIEEL